MEDRKSRRLPQYCVYLLEFYMNGFIFTGQGLLNLSTVLLSSYVNAYR